MMYLVLEKCFKKLIYLLIFRVSGRGGGGFSIPKSTRTKARVCGVRGSGLLGALGSVKVGFFRIGVFGFFG